MIISKFTPQNHQQALFDFAKCGDIKNILKYIKCPNDWEMVLCGAINGNQKELIDNAIINGAEDIGNAIGFVNNEEIIQYLYKKFNPMSIINSTVYLHAGLINNIWLIKYMLKFKFSSRRIIKKIAYKGNVECFQIIFEECKKLYSAVEMSKLRIDIVKTILIRRKNLKKPIVPCFKFEYGDYKFNTCNNNNECFYCDINIDKTVMIFNILFKEGYSFNQNELLHLYMDDPVLFKLLFNK